MATYEPLDLVFGDVVTEARAAHLETQYKLAKGVYMPLGGIPNVGYRSESYAHLPGFILVPMTEDLTVKIQFMGYVSGGTGSVRLANETDSLVVDGSEMTFMTTGVALFTSSELTLIAGKRYVLQSKISDDAEEVFVYGAALVSQ